MAWRTYFGILALSLHKDAYGSVPTAEVVLLFLIPIFDASRLIVERIARGKSPLTPDGRHLHHLVERAIGWWTCMALIAIPLVIYQFLPGRGVPISWLPAPPMHWSSAAAANAAGPCLTKFPDVIGAQAPQR